MYGCNGSPIIIFNTFQFMACYYSTGQVEGVKNGVKDDNWQSITPIHTVLKVMSITLNPKRSKRQPSAVGARRAWSTLWTDLCSRWSEAIEKAQKHTHLQLYYLPCSSKPHTILKLTSNQPCMHSGITQCHKLHGGRLHGELLKPQNSQNREVRGHLPGTIRHVLYAKVFGTKLLPL